MFYLNTTRTLDQAVVGERREQLLALLDGPVLERAFTLPGMLAITFLLSEDGLTMQTFSHWNTMAEAQSAQQSAQHGTNAGLIEDLLGMTQPRQQNSYELLRSFNR